MPNEYDELFSTNFIFGEMSLAFDHYMIDNEANFGNASCWSDKWRDYVAMYCMMSV